MKEEEFYRRLSQRMDKLEEEMKDIRMLLEEKEKDTDTEKGYSSSKVENDVHKPFPMKKKKKTEGSAEQKDWETLIGQVWLPRVFIVVLLIGVVWAFQSAVENNWITEPVRILIGFVAAAGIAFTGIHQMRKHRNGLGVSLIGGGAGVWIFSVFAGTVLYGLIPTPLSFLLYVGGLAAGLYLAHRYQSQALTVLLTVTGFFVPFLVGGEDGNFFVFYFYEIVLVSVLGVYAWRKDYTVLLYASTLLPSVTFAVYTIATALFSSARAGIGPVDYEDLFAFTITAIHILLSVFMYRSGIGSRAKGTLLSLTMATAVMWLFVTPIFSSETYEFGWFTPTVSVFDGCILAGVLLYGGLAIRKRTSPDMLFHLYTLFAVVLGTIILFRLFDYEGYAILLLVEAVLLYRLGFGIRSSIHMPLATTFFLVGALWTIENSGDISSVIDTPVWEGATAALASFLVYLLFRRNDPKEVMTKVMHRYGIYTFASAALGFALLTLTQAAFEIGEEYLYDYRNIVVSVSWVLFAVTLLIAGIQKDRKLLRLFSMAWIFITLAKAFLVDISYIDAAVRGALFIGLGIVGVIVSRFFYRSNKSDTEKTEE